MTIISIDCDNITDWESFHQVFAAAFGFPAFYGMNMNAWVDCLTDLDEPGSGMTSVHVESGSVLTLVLANVAAFKARCPEVYEALVDSCAFVNWRRVENGEPPVLAVAFHR